MGLRIDRRDEGDSTELALGGDLDLETSAALRQALLAVIGESQARHVVVDLEGVDFIDSAGLGVLLGGRERARDADGDLVLVATGRNVLRVLELTGLDRVFEIHVSRASARGAGG
jgi:anti-sigma B factor antagonist